MMNEMYVKHVTDMLNDDCGDKCVPLLGKEFVEFCLSVNAIPELDTRGDDEHYYSYSVYFDNRYIADIFCEAFYFEEVDDWFPMFSVILYTNDPDLEEEDIALYEYWDKGQSFFRYMSKEEVFTLCKNIASWELSEHHRTLPMRASQNLNAAFEIPKKSWDEIYRLIGGDDKVDAKIDDSTLKELDILDAWINQTENPEEALDQVCEWVKYATIRDPRKYFAKKKLYELLRDKYHGKFTVADLRKLNDYPKIDIEFDEEAV